MLKGLFSGGFWGLVVGGAALTTASLVAEQPAGNTPPMAPQVTAPQSGDAPAESVATDAAPAADVAVMEEQAPRAQAPQLEVTQPMADVEPAAVPETGLIADDMVAPAPVETAPEIAATSEAPVLPNPQSVAPQVPMAEQDLIVSTVSIPVPEPVVVDDTAVATPTVDIAVPMPIAPEEVAIAVPELIGTEPASGMPTGDASVKVNRSVPEPEAQAAETVQPIADDAPALVRYGSPFENPEDKPMLSVVLMDDGSMSGAVPALTALPFPVTVILDPSAPDAATKMAEYRGAGIEVGVMAALPEGADASNVAVAFEATFATLPDSVLMLDAGAGGLQNDRAVTEQAMEMLSDDGRGFVTVSKGLNTSLRVAENADVPAVAIYRDLDAEGQDARVIRRFLDQAAFRARQETGVMLLARVRPDTISALILWGTANRAGQVILAPASAVLLAQ